MCVCVCVYVCVCVLCGSKDNRKLFSEVYCKQQFDLARTTLKLSLEQKDGLVNIK